MNQVDPIKIIESFLSERKIVQAHTKEARDEIEYRESEFNDITHALEFKDFNAVMTCKLARELQNSKRIRRKCKDLNELLTPLFDYFNKNHRFFDGLAQVQSEIKKKIEQQNRRRYTIRVREDLREFIEKVQTK